jgi:CheY-like chemotaxis protein
VSVPIIALTADAFSEAAERCRNAGMNAQVTKPVDPALLRKTLSEYMLRVTYK